MIMFVSIICLLGLMFLLSSFLISRKSNDDFRKRTSETAVNNVTSTIDASIDTYNYISRLIMVNERVVSFLHAETANKSMSYEARMGMYEILNMYHNINYIESVYIFRNDKQYAHTGTGNYLIDTECQAYEDVIAQAGAKVISINGNGMITRMDHTPSLTLARAIYDINSQKLLGMLVMNISCNSFEDALKLQKSSELCILDKNGTYLCGNTELADMYQERFCSDELYQKKLRFHGDRSILMGKRTKEPLVVLCCTSINGHTVSGETIWELVSIFIAFLLSTIFCAWFIRTKITTPIHTLDEAMERTKSSGWLERIDEDMPDNEIGRLAERYNSMIDYLNELFERLLQEEENMRKAEMRVLQEQIKPHFLYNTLGTISYITVEEHAERAHDALETLGSFYRNFLSKGDKEIPFGTELGIIRDYLSLQKLRYGSSFETEYIIDENALTYKVPKLMLQPLVENSIYHGVRLKGELCLIRITATLRDDGLHVIIYDSGVGMPEEQIQHILHPHSDKEVQPVSSSGGFGLSGTIERIRYFCNRQDVVSIRSEEGEYTEIEIWIPHITAKESA